MFFDKKFGLPQGLIDAASKVHKENVKEHFVANPKMAHHYEKGELAATVMVDNDEHGNHCGHKVHFFKNGKKQESKTYYAETELDAHDAAKQYVSQGLNSLYKEEVTFSEAELAHINELLVPDTNKVAAGSVSDYFKKRSNTRLDNNKTPFSSAKPERITSDMPGPRKTLALPKPEAKPATHSAEPIVAAHHALHAPEQKGTKPTTLTLPAKDAYLKNHDIKAAARVINNRSGTTAADIAAKQKANSSGNLKGKSIEDMHPRDVRDPMHSDARYDKWKAGQNGVGTKTLPTKVSADPAPKQTSAAAPVGKVDYTLPAGKNTVSTELPKAAKSTPGKKQAGTGKVTGKKTADLTPSVKPNAGKAVRTTKAGAPVQSQEPFRFKGGETHSKPDSIVPPEPKITRAKEVEDKKAAHAGQTNMFGTGAEVKAGTAKMFVKQQKMPDHVVDTNRSMDNLPAINRKKKVAEEFSEKELAHIKAIMEKE